MNRTLKLDKLSFIVLSLLILILCIGMVAAPTISNKGINDGINACLTVLVPSLFPFMFLSTFVVLFGISQRLGRIFSKITECVFNLPSEAGVTILLSLAGGFPVGAVGIASMYKRNLITEKQARRMLLFCVNPGPGFLIGTVGSSLYGSAAAGLILTAAQSFAAILTGIIAGQFSKKKEPLVKTISAAHGHMTFSDAFVLSCKSACKSMAMLCSMVMLFSCFTELAEHYLNFSPDSAVGIIFRCICEVTDGCTAIAENRLPLYMAATCSGFGGLCVHFQIFSAVTNIGINKPKFVFARVIAGLLCGAATYLICMFTPISSDVFSNIEETAAEISSVTYCASAALLITIISFLICTSGIFTKSKA